MAKYLIETYYTCSFKVTHYLENVDEKELANLEKRDDGKFEILDVKLDNRKTKNLTKSLKTSDDKIISNEVINETTKPKVVSNDVNQKFIKKINEGVGKRLVCLTEEKAIYKKFQLENTKYIYIQANMRTER